MHFLWQLFGWTRSFLPYDKTTRVHIENRVKSDRITSKIFALLDCKWGNIECRNGFKTLSVIVYSNYLHITYPLYTTTYFLFYNAGGSFFNIFHLIELGTKIIYIYMLRRRIEILWRLLCWFILSESNWYDGMFCVDGLFSFFW